MTRTTTFARARRPVPPRPSELQSQSAALYSLAQILAEDIAALNRPSPSERNVHGLPAAWSALRKISNACGQMMAAAQAFGPDGTTKLAAPAVLELPCASYDPFDFWREVFSHGLARGNWIGIKYDHDPVTGYPRQVMPVPIDSVHASWEEGFPVYRIGGRPYMADEIVHIRFGLTVPGEIMAVGVIEAHRTGLQAMIDQSAMAGSIWREGGIPSGLVQLDIDQPTATQAQTVKANWIGVHGGRRTVGVIGKKMTYVPVPWSADDAQFLESRQFSIAECALMFGLRPEDLGASFGASSGAQSYGNRTDDALQRIVDAYTPVMLPAEQAWSRLIPGRNFVRGDAEVLLRSTPEQRMNLHKLAQEVGVETIDETRELEGKPPLPKSPTPTPPAPAEDDPEDPEDPEDDPEVTP
jgi:phage portal protein BeeE